MTALPDLDPWLHENLPAPHCDGDTHCPNQARVRVVTVCGCTVLTCAAHALQQKQAVRTALREGRIWRCNDHGRLIYDVAVIRIPEVTP